MATIEITKDNLRDTIMNNEIVVLDFWAGWCGPCVNFAPIFEQASEKHADIVFGKIDTEAQQEIAAAFQITSIPTLMAFREGMGVFAQPGSLPPAALDKLVDAVRELDMTEVRAQAEAEAQAAATATESAK